MNKSTMRDLSEAEGILRYTFRDKSLLTRAFTHASYSNENRQTENYERLEFLGDAILDYVIGVAVYRHFPTSPEGFLTARRAYLVKADTLAEIVDELRLMPYLRVGANAESTVSGSVNVKCDLFEAIVGAIYLDSASIDAAQTFVMRHLEKKIDEYDVDYKSKTLEYCAKNRIDCSLLTEKVFDSEKEFHFCATLYIKGKPLYTGEGHSKRIAEKAACKQYYDTFIL